MSEQTSAMGFETPQRASLAIDQPLVPTRKPRAKPKAAPPPPAKPAPRKTGRPPYAANDMDRRMVRLLCAGGSKQSSIAAMIGISEPTLRKHYKSELLISKAEMDGRAVNALAQAMMRGGMEAVIAAKWWTQSRMGWGKRVIAGNGKPVAPPRVIVEFVDAAAAPRVEQSASRTGFSDTIRKDVQRVG